MTTLSSTAHMTSLGPVANRAPAPAGPPPLTVGEVAAGLAAGTAAGFVGGGLTLGYVSAIANGIVSVAEGGVHAKPMPMGLILGGIALLGIPFGMMAFNGVTDSMRSARLSQ